MSPIFSRLFIKKRRGRYQGRSNFLFVFTLIDFRRLMEDDDGALSEIEPDSVPNEVRDWLTITFTRSMSTIKRRTSDKPKFKSVAQAIRAGIMVDRWSTNEMIERFLFCKKISFTFRYLRRLSIDIKFKVKHLNYQFVFNNCRFFLDNQWMDVRCFFGERIYQRPMPSIRWLWAHATVQSSE